MYARQDGCTVCSDPSVCQSACRQHQPCNKCCSAELATHAAQAMARAVADVRGSRVMHCFRRLRIVMSFWFLSTPQLVAT